MSAIRLLNQVHKKIRVCRECPNMCGKPVHGVALETRVMLFGQAPGTHEESLGRPFAHTAGKTLFKWFSDSVGLKEEEFRERVYITAAARCFPGKNPKGAGDREPNATEIANCRRHVSAEVAALKPELLIAVGRVAIAEALGPALFPKGKTLADVVGRKFRVKFHGHEMDVIPLPHPSGVSRWPQTEPGKTKLREALGIISNHPAWE
jgi:uracil-DNA glycosylase